MDFDKLIDTLTKLIALLQAFKTFKDGSSQTVTIVDGDKPTVNYPSKMTSGIYKGVAEK